jgi:hypothetical protein
MPRTSCMISNRIEKAHIQLSLVATPKVTQASQSILDFQHDNPHGGRYNGEMYCLQQLRGGIGGVESALRDALRECITTPTQRPAGRVWRSAIISAVWAGSAELIQRVPQRDSRLRPRRRRSWLRAQDLMPATRGAEKANITNAPIIRAAMSVVLSSTATA